MRKKDIEILIASQRENIVPSVFDNIKQNLNFTFNADEKVKKTSFKINFGFKPLMALLTVLIIAVTLIFGNTYTDNTELSTIYLDINPSFGLVINKKLDIIKVIEPESQNINAEIKLIGKNIDDAVLLVLDYATKKGIINRIEENALSISALEDDFKGNNIIKNLNQKINKYFIEKQIICRILDEAYSASIKEQANTLNISPGKLKIINRIIALDNNLTVKQLENKPIRFLNNLLKKYTEALVNQDNLNTDNDTEDNNGNGNNNDNGNGNNNGSGNSNNGIGIGNGNNR